MELEKHVLRARYDNPIIVSEKDTAIDIGGIYLRKNLASLVVNASITLVSSDITEFTVSVDQTLLST